MSIATIEISDIEMDSFEPVGSDLTIFDENIVDTSAYPETIGASNEAVFELQDDFTMDIDSIDDSLEETLRRYEAGEVVGDDELDRFVEKVETAFLDLAFNDRYDELLLLSRRLRDLCTHNHDMLDKLSNIFDSFLGPETKDTHKNDHEEDEKKKKKQRRKVERNGWLASLFASILKSKRDAKH